MFVKNFDKGFSIIEIMVFVSLVSIILVAAAGFTVQIIKNMTYNQHKIYATRYVEDVKEWLDGERQADWVDFEKMADGSTYCLNSDIGLDYGVLDLTVPASCEFVGIVGTTPAIFKRTLTLSTSGTTVNALIQVEWNEGVDLKTESLETVYSVWQ